MIHRLLTRLVMLNRITDLSKQFEDIQEVSEYAKNSVTLLYNAGILQGNENRFLPKNQATRAEAAQLIYNILIQNGGGVI